VDELQAKALLDHVIRISRVEMYKPIQVAEVLRQALRDPSIRLGEKESYRIPSRRWRDEVTQFLYGKVCTSSARFQDDLWNESAVPPQAMCELGRCNELGQQVEAYIYAHVMEKSKDLFLVRTRIGGLQSGSDIEALVALFDSDGMTSSADRFFEILTTAVFKTELSILPWSVKVYAPAPGNQSTASWAFVERLSLSEKPVTVDRLGRTNAADAGVDIWSNCGVVINVKRRVLTSDLLSQVLDDTPVGDLHIVCLSVDPAAKSKLKKSSNTDRTVTVSTATDIIDAGTTLLSSTKTAMPFREHLLSLFDKEFPTALTMRKFMERRGYLNLSSSAIWAP